MHELPKRPRIFPLLLLKCPYCGQSSLQRKGSWFDFADGCHICDYRYEREVGYYAGSTWMVNYAVISLFGILVAAFCAIATNLDGLMIATVASISVVVFGVVFFPYGNACWLFVDHVLHPLRESDRLSVHGTVRSAGVD